jgi:hypothetical protein
MGRKSTGTNEIDHDAAAESSLAVPPLYVLRAAERCPKCRQALHVFALGCDAFVDAEEHEAIEAFHLLTFVRHLPDRLLRILATKCTGYYFDHSDSQEAPYLMNHCRCGAQLDDATLHWDVGGAFCPDTPEGYDTIKLSRLPIDTPIAIECSYTIGGGQYLDTEAVKPW